MDSRNQEKPERCLLYWDYYGPSSQGTAEHFLAHLKTWLANQAMENEAQDLAVKVISPNHSSVTCSLPFEMGRQVYTVLKAQRAVAVNP